MSVVIFEDESADDLGPLAYLRPAFDLWCGRWSLKDRLLRRLTHNTDWACLVRPWLAAVVRESLPERPVNDWHWMSSRRVLLVNGRWLVPAGDLPPLGPDDVGVLDGKVVCLPCEPLEAGALSEQEIADSIERIARQRNAVEMPGSFIHRPWDLVAANPEQLRRDWDELSAAGTWLPLPRGVEVVGPRSRLAVDPAAQLDPFVVLDTRSGTISIEAGVQVQAFTRISGPCHIAAGCQVFRALIREGCTIGPQCRIGGELEESILQGWVNKYHDGFLGHSYVGSWVNLGALSTTSDLKNDYSDVSVPLRGESENTGTHKLGSFIGDHTKTALDSMFNTGSSIGVFAMVLPAGRLLPKHIPSFARYWNGQVAEPWDVQRSVETARIAMSRRDVTLTPAHERLIEHVFAATAGERDACARYQAARTGG